MNSNCLSAETINFMSMMTNLCRLVCELGYVLRVTDNRVDGTKDLGDQHGMSILQKASIGLHSR